MELEEEATSIAKYRSDLVTSPERCRRRSAILAYWLQIPRFTVSKCCHISHKCPQPQVSPLSNQSLLFHFTLNRSFFFL